MAHAGQIPTRGLAADSPPYPRRGALSIQDARAFMRCRMRPAALAAARERGLIPVPIVKGYSFLKTEAGRPAHQSRSLLK